jgi:hypothetical protein
MENNKTIKTTVEIPIKLSKKINACIDRFDTNKPRSRQEFMLLAIIDKLNSYYGENTDNSKNSVNEENKSKSKNTFLEKWRG